MAATDTNVLAFNTVSGSSYVLNVSALSLLPAIDTKDFTVTHNGVDRTIDYTKTSQTQITYAGTSVVLGTLVRVYRSTPLTVSEATYVGVTTAAQLTNAMTKLKRRVDELESLINYQSSLIASAGITVGLLPILDVAYGASWDADATNVPSRNSVYDVINRIDTGANTWTGSYNMSSASNVTVPTQLGSDSSTKVSNTAQTQAAINNRVRLIANRTTPATVATGSGFQNLPLDNTIVNLDSYNTGTYVWTCPTTGVYKITVLAAVITSGGTPPTRTRTTVGVQLNGTTDVQLGGSEVDSNYAYGSGTVVMSVTAGNTLKPRVFVEHVGGSAYATQVAFNSTLPTFISIERVN